MIWSAPISLFGGNTVIVSLTADTLIGNLWNYLDNPAGPVSVTVIADNCDVGNIIVPVDFHPDSEFQFNAINGGRFLGLGGAGGAGGDDNGASGTQGTKGSSGGHAITAYGFDINVDIDNGYLYGGGGGGGGGSFNDLGANGTAGGGGGGGRGFGTSSGGSAGANDVGALDGGDGTATAAGVGGDGGTPNTNDGGDGGDFGYCGEVGQFATPGVTELGFNVAGNGGPGGDAGSAFMPFNGATITFNGLKSQSTLEAESRIAGEVGGRIFLPSPYFRVNDVIFSGSKEIGFLVNNDTGGTLQSFEDTTFTNHGSAWYIGDSITASDFEVRAVPGTEGGNGWDTDPGATGTWVNLGTAREWSIFVSAASQTASGVIEIGRAGENTGRASGLLLAAIQYNPP